MYKTLNLKLLKSKLTNFNNHKGQSGKIAIIGGSMEYTGAPYYAGVSSLKSVQFIIYQQGGDLTYILCHIDASIPIKSYHPELIVIPQWDDNIYLYYMNLLLIVIILILIELILL